MISEQDKLYLKEKFNVDANMYTEDQLNVILDNIILKLQYLVEGKKTELNLLLQELDNYNN